MVFTTAPIIVEYENILVSFTAVKMLPKKPAKPPKTKEIINGGTYFHATKKLFAYKICANGIVNIINIEQHKTKKPLYASYISATK